MTSNDSNLMYNDYFIFSRASLYKYVESSIEHYNDMRYKFIVPDYKPK